jgi:putative transposase
MDLRERVVAAIADGGMSRHAAAVHFGVAVSTAIKWMQRVRLTGSAAPGQMGGHKPRAICGAQRDWLIERCRRQDFTLRGLVAELAERGLKVDYRSVWAFVHAEKLSYKKNRSRSRAGSARYRPSPRPVAEIPEPNRAIAPGLHR